MGGVPPLQVRLDFGVPIRSLVDVQLEALLTFLDDVRVALTSFLGRFLCGQVVVLDLDVDPVSVVLPDGEASVDDVHAARLVDERVRSGEAQVGRGRFRDVSLGELGNAEVESGGRSVGVCSVVVLQ